MKYKNHKNFGKIGKHFRLNFGSFLLLRKNFINILGECHGSIDQSLALEIFEKTLG